MMAGMEHGSNKAREEKEKKDDDGVWPLVAVWGRRAPTLPPGLAGRSLGGGRWA